jgi:DNA replication protein DnaC
VLNGIFIGHSGTGKSHMAKSIVYSAVRYGMHAVYVEADERLGNLVLAGAESEAFLRCRTSHAALDFF